MSNRMLVLGLMSGSSAESVDVALVETDGEKVHRRGPAAAYAYTDAHRAAIAAAVHMAAQAKGRPAGNGTLAAAEDAVTQAHANAVRNFLTTNHIPPGRVDAAGFHGQTILHRPDDGVSVQIGDGEQLSDITGINMVYEFRTADMAAGGKGAPLASVYHRAVMAKAGLKAPLALVSIGDVANVTWIGADGSMLAFDTGPGNFLLNEWSLRQTGEAFDNDGKLAGRGSVQEDAVDAFLTHPYFRRPPPKSLDTSDFSLFFVEGLGLFDAAATLAAITVEAIVRGIDFMPEPPQRWIITGAGARNPVLMTRLRKRLGGRVETARAVGLSARFMEAEALGFLAVRSLRGRPLTFPETTGVLRPTCGGIAVAPGRKPLSQALAL